MALPELPPEKNDEVRFAFTSAQLGLCEVVGRLGHEPTSFELLAGAVRRAEENKKGGQAARPISTG